MRKYTAIIIIVVSFAALGFKPRGTHDQSNGRQLFFQRCAMCHNAAKSIVGPPFQGIRKDYSPAWINAMVRDHNTMCLTNDIRAQYVFRVWDRSVSDANNKDLSDNDIDAILDYVDSMPIASNTMHTGE